MTERMQDLSVSIATKTNRSRFLRRSATTVFGTVATLAAGKLAFPDRAFAYQQVCESSTGQGCPHGCGPSRCCVSQSSSCNCGTGTNCDNNVGVGGHCAGYEGDWGGVNCWTCTWYQCSGGVYYQISTTCCDCHTTGGCDTDGICISYKTTQTVEGYCAPTGGPPQLSGKPQVVGVATGDPKTTWGDTSLAFPSHD